MPDEAPPEEPHEMPVTEPGPREDPARQSWLGAAAIVGLVCGMLAGLVEPVHRMWAVRGLMTARLWAEAFSFSVLTHTAAWLAGCGITCLLGRVAAGRSAWWRRRILPGPLALATFLIGLTVVVAWGEAALRAISFTKGLTGVMGSTLAGLALLVPVAWVCTWFRRTWPGRRVAGAARVAVWPAIALVVASGVFQWATRSRVQSPEGFWTSASSQPASRPGGGGPPDVVLIVLDTLRADRLGCYGYGRPTTPHIDAFAADAVQFQRAISPGVWTEPAHASIFTGLFRSQHGVGWNRIWLDDRFITLAEILRDRGYQTIAVSNNPNVSPGTNLTQGFDTFAEPPRLSFTTRCCLYTFIKQVWAREEALGALLGRWFVYDPGGHATTPVIAQHLRRRDPNRPLFLFVNYMEPHLPYEPRRAYRTAFVDAGDLAHSYRVDQNLDTVFQYNLVRKSIYGARDLKILSDLYDARVREMDDHFADLIRVLYAEVDLDDTLVILTSDHGESLGNHELMGHQFCIYNTLIHVPLIIRWPRVLRPQRVDRVVQTSDLFPTVSAWAGAKPSQSAKVLARPLGEALQSTADSVYRTAVAEYLHPPSWAFKIARQHDPTFDHTPWMVAFRTIVDQKWKLIHRSDQRMELYDLSNDPAEEQDRFRSHRTQADRLQRLYRNWRRSFEPFDPNHFTGPPTGHRLTDEQRRQLRDLGYVQ